MALDIYSTRAQLAAIELMPTPNNFIMDLFVKDEGVIDDEKAICDVMKGGEVMAPIVHPGVGGVLLDRPGYETREIGFATIAPERIIVPTDLKNRAFGERILGGKTPEQREKDMLRKDLADMKAAIQNTRAYMARQVITTGRLELFRFTHEGRDKETTLVADYGFSNNFTPDKAWDQADATIADDMKEIVDLVTEGLGNVDVIVMASDVASAVMSNANYIKTLDVINMRAGEINTKYRGQGVRFLGYNADGIEMYSYSGKYTDWDGSRKPILPSGKLIAGSRGMIKMLHGPVTQIEETGMNAVHKTYINKEVPLRYASVESNSLKNRVTSCPTFMPYNVDGWVIADVL